MSSSLQAIKQRFGIIGASHLLDAALNTAAQVAPTELSVLIQGGSGVGKEVFSKVIHALSKRKHNPFIAINCGAIPAGTINSELFGHEKGAFTGAVSDRKGYFETVNGGTIFLDEIGEMPLDTQAMLLRILENGEFVRVGSSKVEKTDVRVIAATNVNLEKAIQKKEFREDLFYRLSTVPIKVPALRERPEDIYMLFRKFCVDFAEKNRMQPIQLDEGARLLLENYNWPGNIRELKNVAEGLSVLSEERMITVERLIEQMPQLLTRALPSAAPASDEESSFSERDIVFKFLYDMKNDLNYVKKVIAELIKSNDLTPPRSFSGQNWGLPAPQPRPDFSHYDNAHANFMSNGEVYEDNVFSESDIVPNVPYQPSNKSPIIITNPQKQIETQRPIYEGSLNLADKEKEIIIIALKKHQNKRKEAAEDLGISERTLYRKIKDYDLGE
ncbi:MAG: sigma-54-dependent Fis family transcriptional regulator [Saprospiraceae bacterium]|nr:sigma-54-dependent Fis family transcriptional regulator [Saprospiraceae bacterium]